jgi:hypothetical protein
MVVDGVDQFHAFIQALIASTRGSTASRDMFGFKAVGAVDDPSTAEQLAALESLVIASFSSS